MAAADPAPSEAQNYFAMLRETPATLLPLLVAQRGCSDATAERVAALLGCDLVRNMSPCPPSIKPLSMLMCMAFLLMLCCVLVK